MPKSVPLPQLLGTVEWHALARCLPDEDGEPWALGMAMGRGPEQEWFKKTVCAGCPVRDECLDDAMAFWVATGSNPSGVWGGTSKGEREVLMARWKADAAGMEEAS